MTEYEDYDELCNEIREENQVLLSGFESWMSENGLSKSTVKKHKENIDFYINDFMLYEDPIPATEGIDKVGEFLGYWFIRKAMWASESSVRSNARSIKKFYDFMMERGKVEAEAVKDMKKRVKEELPEWVAAVGRYDDPSIAVEDVWQW